MIRLAVASGPGLGAFTWALAKGTDVRFGNSIGGGVYYRAVRKCSAPSAELRTIGTMLQLRA